MIVFLRHLITLNVRLITMSWFITVEGDEQIIIRNLTQEQITNIRQIQHPAIRDFVPAFSTIGISYACLSAHTYNELCALIKQALSTDSTLTQQQEAELLELPICYEHGLDVHEIAQQLQLSDEEVIHAHLNSTFTVALLGFAPGAPYMTGLDPKLSTITRKSNPRTSIEAGSVGIANGQCFIYPKTSPGGWQILGRCPLALFDKTQSKKYDLTLLHPGQKVRFVRINPDEFKAMNELEQTL